jgi:hypothetical protein
MSFFQRNYNILKDFCDTSDGSLDVKHVYRCIQQYADNASRPKPTKMPDDFLSDEKVDMWRMLIKKLKEGGCLPDAIHNQMDAIWDQWSHLLYEKEQEEEDAGPSCFISPHSMNSSPFRTPQQYFPSAFSSPGINDSPYASSPSASPMASNCSTYPSPAPSLIISSSSKPSPRYIPSPLSSPMSSNQPSPMRSNTPSTNPSPRHSHSSDSTVCSHDHEHESDHFKGESINIRTTENQLYGVYYFAKKGSDKYVCQTDGCKRHLTEKKESKIRYDGVTRETLISHAAKYHSISLDLKRRIGTLETPFYCTTCSTPFGRRQTLTNHQEKCHTTAILANTKPACSIQSSETTDAELPLTTPIPTYSLTQEKKCKKDKPLNPQMSTYNQSPTDDLGIMSCKDVLMSSTIETDLLFEDVSMDAELPGETLDDLERKKKAIITKILKPTSKHPKISLRRVSSDNSDQHSAGSNSESNNIPTCNQPKGGPAVGDVVQFFEQKKSAWVKCKITSRSNYKHYYNFIYETGEVDGIYLRPNMPYWTVLDSSQWCDIVTLTLKHVPQFMETDEHGSHPEVGQSFNVDAMQLQSNNIPANPEKSEISQPHQIS